MLIGLTYDLRSEYLAAGYSDLETAETDSLDPYGILDAGGIPCIVYSRRIDYVSRQLSYGIENLTDLKQPVWAPGTWEAVGSPEPVGNGISEWVTFRYLGTEPLLGVRVRVSGPE